jgi:hypothetical protein
MMSSRVVRQMISKVEARLALSHGDIELWTSTTLDHRDGV